MIKQRIYRRDFKSPRDLTWRALEGFFVPLTRRRKSYGANPVVEMPEGDGESSRTADVMTGDEDGGSDEVLACRRLR